MQGLIDDDEYHASKLYDLELLDERRHNALVHLHSYQNHLHHSYNKKVLFKHFNINDLVLMESPKNQAERAKLAKFEPNSLVLYIITAVYGSGAYYLSTREDESFLEPVNSLHLHKFYT